jgi:hypothetical protein
MCSEGVIPLAINVKYMQSRVESPFPSQSGYGEKSLICGKSGIASTPVYSVALFTSADMALA